ncbi:hypothetical protein Tco_1398324, partial [Tanacetum coccineum]
SSVGEESHLAIKTNDHEATKENHWLHDGAYLMFAMEYLLIICIECIILIDRGLVGALEASVVKWKEWSGCRGGGGADGGVDEPQWRRVAAGGVDEGGVRVEPR